MKIKRLQKIILICGTGRWANIHLNEIIKLNFFDKIYIFSRNKIKNRNFFSDNIQNIIHVSNFAKINFSNINLVTLTSHNKNNYSYLRKLMKIKSDILIEKPINFNEIELNKILISRKLSKTYLSMPWLYDDNLKKIAKLIKNEKIKNIKFFWYANDKKRYGANRKFDKSIFFSQDIISHILSILMRITGNANVKFIYENFYIRKKNEFLNFTYDKYKINLKCNRINNINKRKIMINLDDGNSLTIYLGTNIVSLYKNNELIYRNKALKNNLLKQYKYLLFSKSSNMSLNYDMIKKINSITKEIKLY